MKEPKCRINKYTDLPLVTVQNYPNPTEEECEIALPLCRKNISKLLYEINDLNQKMHDAKNSQNDFEKALLKIKRTGGAK